MNDSKPDDAVARLKRLLLGMPARIEQPDPLILLVQSGSRLRYRLFGAWVSGPYLPMRLRFDAKPDPRGTMVRLSMTSNEGWYLVQTALGRAAYDARFTDILEVIEAEGFTRVK